MNEMNKGAATTGNEQLHVHISLGNSKLGKAIPSVNLPVCMSCRKDAPCFNKCYGQKGRFRFGNVQNTLDRNWHVWSTDPERFENEVCIGAYTAKFFRWHSVGDIPSMEYLAMMVRIARRLPGTRFLCFTKRFELVNQYIREIEEAGESMPENLVMVFSAWGNWMPENPHNLPVAYIRFKKAETFVPENAMECKKFCGACVMGEKSCWQLGCGQSVVFNEH